MPRPVVLNIATIDLTQPGIRFGLTNGSRGKFMFRAATTSEFLESQHAQLAVNASFFWPFKSHHPLDYYPHEGDPVRPCGLYARQGRVISDSHKLFPSLFISKSSEISFDSPKGPVYDAISGNFLLLRQGVVQDASSLPPDQRVVQPRTAVALTADRRTMFLVVVDGRQPNCSEGLGLEELARILRDLGASDALNLDGGGSEAMAAEGPGGHAVLLNRPIDLYMPGRERAVATHLCVFANRVNPAAPQSSGAIR